VDTSAPPSIPPPRGHPAWRSSSAGVVGPAPRWERTTPPGRPSRPPATSLSSATMVLPEPTSPCSSRCMGWSIAEFGADLLADSNCPSVNSKGSCASKASSSPPVQSGSGAGREWTRSLDALRASTTWVTHASSYLMRLRPWSSGPNCRAGGSRSRPCAGRASPSLLPESHAGSGSGISSTRSRAIRMTSSICQVVKSLDLRDRWGSGWQARRCPFAIGAIEPALRVGQLPLVTEPLQAPTKSPLRPGLISRARH
jgi:hypothetical protein